MKNDALQRATLRTTEGTFCDSSPYLDTDPVPAEQALSEEVVSEATDKAMDNGTKGDVASGISRRFGPVDGDVEMKDVEDGVNGSGKRKARTSSGQPSYAESESSEDDKPLV